MLLAVLVLLLALLLILAIPVSLSYRASWKQVFRGQVKLRLAYGLVSIERNFPASHTPSMQTGKGRGAVPRAPSSSAGSFVAALRRPLFRRRLLRLLNDLWHAFQKTGFRASVHIGLDDPAATGQLWAIMGPLAGMFAGQRGTCLVIEPVFHESRFDFDSSGNIRVMPLKLIAIVLSFLLSPTVWKTLRHNR